MDKKITLFIILFLVLALCAGCSSDKRPKYKNRVFQFSVRYNPTWEVKNDIGSAVVAFLAPRVDESDIFQENLTVTIQDLREKITLEQYSQAVVDQVKAFGKLKDVTVNIIESAPMKISGKPGHKLVYALTQYGNPPEFVEAGISPSLDEKGETVQMMLAWTIRDDRAYLLTYSAQKDTYSLYWNEIDAMVKSFRFI